MMPQLQATFALENFEGPLEFLLYLVRKNEIEIYDIAICKITEQFLNQMQHMKDMGLEVGAEFISTAAYLLWLKSKTLLPQHESIESKVEEEQLDPQFNIINHLLDYCHFKQAAKSLIEMEQKQNAYYPRPFSMVPEIKKRMGIEHISLDELAQFFQVAIAKASSIKEPIRGETWRVTDKLNELKKLIRDKQEINICTLFKLNKSRLELIAIFLAVLELLKLGEIQIGKDSLNDDIIIFEAQQLQLNIWQKN